MNQDAGTVESRRLGLDAHGEARKFVRLLQCSQCARPYRSPVTLPCGNSLCRECLPEAHEREGISYPDIPNRRKGIQCPFPSCEREHSASDCNVDVALNKVMEVIAEVFARYENIISNKLRAQGDTDVQMQEQVLGEVLDEKAESETSLPRGRLLAAYILAMQGQLSLDSDTIKYDSGTAAESERSADFTMMHDISDTALPQVDCQVCYNLMLDPVTTFCGHTLCRVCMSRVLDHSLHCPICRRVLALPPTIGLHPNNKTLVDLSNTLWPDMVKARRETVAAEEQEIAQGDMNTPLFVCTLGFPEQPTFLRIFEPRYRLMLRRCLEGSREFGILMYNRYSEPQGDLGPVHFYQIGTMLRIVRAQLLADGTSLVETVGTERFRVTRHGVADGYAIGNVELIHDVNLAEEERIEAAETSQPPPADEEDVHAQIARMPTVDLLRFGQEFVRRMQGRSANWLQQRVLDIHGQPPDDARLFPYWFASVLPISEEEKYKLLDTRTVRDRLKITAAWIKRIESQRW
ncbi:uncharacterized protein LTR77_005719 [Saxophila tyrrhenica]|uniref:Uncharacterized protein n=1 Tax=Saxophila tyrrhenica TaxID=1690608 RepID=A0AAV9P994_9PEZI|nr:hypothetical protein LTR77_005719 [Saxophila tyrrhenica]